MTDPVPLDDTCAPANTSANPSPDAATDTAETVHPAGGCHACVTPSPHAPSRDAPPSAPISHDAVRARLGTAKAGDGVTVSWSYGLEPRHTWLGTLRSCRGHPRGGKSSTVLFVEDPEEVVRQLPYSGVSYWDVTLHPAERQATAAPPTRATKRTNPAPMTTPHTTPAPAPSGYTDLDAVDIRTWSVLPATFYQGLVDATRPMVYGYATMLPREKEEALHAFLSLPKWHLRRSSGAASTQHRNLRESLATPQLAIPENCLKKQSSTDADTRAVRSATMKAADGYLGRACRSLDNVAHESTLSESELIAKLQTLHPPGAPLTAPTPHHAIIHIGPAELAATVAGMASGAAPGPTGWTEELLAVLFRDEPTALALAHMVTDVANNEVAPSVRRRLVRCRLIGIPKVGNGIRPIAIGEVLVKIAGHILLQQNAGEIAKAFQGLQMGVLSRGGGELIIHTVRDLYAKGASVMTIDMVNAFNSPGRLHIQSALTHPAFSPFSALFDLEYASPSELLVTTKSGVHVVSSSCGTRQGSSLGGLYFCAVMHSIVEECARAFPSVRVQCYMDDITVCGPATDLAEVYAFLRPRMGDIGLNFNPMKCEILLAEGCTLPLDLANAVKVCPSTIKVLGAYIGCPRSAADLLVAKAEKHRCLFARMAAMGGPLGLSLLTRCAQPRAGYNIRTHTPHVTDPMCIVFDNLMVEVFVTLSEARLEAEHLAMLRLPTAMGGLGLPAVRELRELAYLASLHSALPPDGPPAPAQRVAAGVLHAALKVQLVADAPAVARLLGETSQPGASVWLGDFARKWNTKHFAGALRYRLNAAHLLDPVVQMCPGCRNTHPATTILAHAVGCARIAGANCTVKHHDIVAALAKQCNEGNLKCEKEPREYNSWKCRTCGDLFSAGEITAHTRLCCPPGSSPFRTGPDLRVWFPEEIVVADVTVVHATSPSYERTDRGDIVAAKAAHKGALYAEQLAAMGERFLVFAVFSHGGLTKESRTLVRQIAAGRLGKKAVAAGIESAVSAALHQGNGATVERVRAFNQALRRMG